MDWSSHLINVVGHKLASSCYASLSIDSLVLLLSFVEIDPTDEILKCRSGAVIMSNLNLLKGL